MRFRTLLTTASALALGVGMMAGSASANNDLVVEQVGDGNFSDHGQRGDDNQTNILQGQNSDQSIPARNTASVPVVNGDDNRILANQATGANYAEARVKSDDNVIGIEQKTGRRNIADLEGGDDVYAGGSFQNMGGHRVGVIQNGEDNVVAGGASGDRSVGAGNDTNTQNFDSVTIESDESLAQALGNAESALIRGADNTVGIEQQGDDNRVALAVNGSGNVIQGSLPSGFPQGTGSFDLANAGSLGFTSPSEINPSNGFFIQEGTNNTSVLVQDGSNNEISHGQDGDDNSAEIVQNGDGNVAWAGQNSADF